MVLSGNKPLPEPILTKVFDAIWVTRQATMGYIEKTVFTGKGSHYDLYNENFMLVWGHLHIKVAPRSLFQYKRDF